MDLDTTYIYRLMQQTKSSCISYSQLHPLLPTQQPFKHFLLFQVFSEKDLLKRKGFVFFNTKHLITTNTNILLLGKMFILCFLCLSLLIYCKRKH